MGFLTNKKKGPIIIIIGLFFIQTNCFSQLNKYLLKKDSLSNKRLIALGSVSGLASFSALYIVNESWYGDFKKVPFHFFNDNKDWLLMDKAGHFLSSFHGGKYGYHALRWTGLSENKSIWIGGVYGFGFLLVTEAMDGFSSAWGASPGDLISNGLGSTMFITQQLLFKKQIITPKFSYWPSKYSEYRPELLGDNHWNRWLKDYNGQIYWLSFSLADMKVSEKYFPKWLSLAFGYGGDGMLGGTNNPLFNEDGNSLPTFKRKREFYLSLDLNYQNIKSKSKILKMFLKGISFLKVPFSSLSISGNKIYFNPITY